MFKNGVRRRAAAPGQLKFGSEDAFYRELRKRVNEFFKRTGRKQRDCPQMYVKTALILGWFAASYVLLVFFATTWWQAVPLAISLALSMAAIGFNIQHDGSHGAYSEHPWINKLMALTLDLLGGSSYGWACKHNIVHHTYANITGHDDDIDIGILGRLSPHQKRFSFHRWQHIYLWVLYGFVAIKWHFYDDFRDLAIGRFGGYRHPRPKGWDLVTFIGGKVLFFSLAIRNPAAGASFFDRAGVLHGDVVCAGNRAEHGFPTAALRRKTLRFRCRKPTRDEWKRLGRCTRSKPRSTTDAETACFRGLSAG